MISFSGGILAVVWLSTICPAMEIPISEPAMEIHIPEDYSTIQEGIDAVPCTGAKVIVAPGIYSPDTNGEQYPLIMESAVFLKGEEGAELSAGTNAVEIQISPDSGKPGS